MLPPQPTDEALIDAARAHVRRLYGPGRRPRRITVELDDNELLVLPVPIPWATPPGHTEAGTRFIPTALQQGILDALAGGVALRTDALAAAVGCDRRSLFKHRGGLKELQEQRLVDHNPRLGYFSVEDPPEALLGDVGEE